MTRVTRMLMAARVELLKNGLNQAWQSLLLISQCSQLLAVRALAVSTHTDWRPRVLTIKTFRLKLIDGNANGGSMRGSWGQRHRGRSDPLCRVSTWSQLGYRSCGGRTGWRVTM